SADLGLVGAIAAQFAVVWITDAPAEAALARLVWRASENLKLMSSKKPIGICFAALAVAAGVPAGTTSTNRAMRTEGLRTMNNPPRSDPDPPGTLATGFEAGVKGRRYHDGTPGTPPEAQFRPRM